MLHTFLEQAAAGRPVYLSDVRAAFQVCGTRPLHIHAALYDGSTRVFPLALPGTEGQSQADFLAEYVYAHIYNILSTLGAARMDLYLDRSDNRLLALAHGLDGVFQTRAAKEERAGYGKCLNVNERVLSALSGGAERLAFRIFDIKEEPAVSETLPHSAVRPVFGQLPGRLAGRMILGMDVGGTDVKLAVSAGGCLALCKEFDWLPSACACAEEITGPLLLLTRLLRAAGSLCMAGREGEVDRAALDRGASLAEMERASEAMERSAGADLRPFDAIGLSFPDVVIQNRVVGGETPKTQGMRRNSALDYETQFAKVTALNEALAAYHAAGPVLCVNDGPMAAFTAAVEQGAARTDLSRGFFAHSLGTDLGTGWVRPDGSIPDIPLEVYNLIIDLGSWDQRAFPPEDVRSVSSLNTGLPGAVQKYGGQSAVFRLAANRLPRQAPQVFQEALDRGLFRWEEGQLIVPTWPEDRRKECLEFFMKRAAQPEEGACQEMFREIGEYLAVIWQETGFLLRPEAEERTLFGRMVKEPACFRLLCEGAARREPELRLLAADGSLANTPLMRQLAARPDCTVAQFAQAVGAVYYGCLGLS